jgi:regulator of protease activity HflC (stomatin/prohibitin superfamily)
MEYEVEIMGSNLSTAVFLGTVIWIIVRFVISGLFTVDQNERAVKTIFGRADRLGSQTTLDHPISQSLREDEKSRYVYPQLRVIQPGGPYFKWPWEKVIKVSVAIQTVDIGYDPESPTANGGGKILEAVTKDQLNTGLRGQMRFSVSDQNLYAFVFGVKNPIAHVMGYFISILRQRIAVFEAQKRGADAEEDMFAASRVQGVSINDLRKNLSTLNQDMEAECRSSIARYGINLDAALITGIDPPNDVESALAAINTAHNQVSSEVSLAQAAADQKIVQSRKAVEISTMQAQAEVQMLTQLSEQLKILKGGGESAISNYIRNVKLKLYSQANRILMEVKS